MSWLVPEAVRRAVGTTDYPALTTGAGLAVLLLLVALLVEAQLVQASRASRFDIRRPVRILAVPLLLAFAFVVAVRIVDLLAYR